MAKEVVKNGHDLELVEKQAQQFKSEIDQRKEKARKDVDELEFGVSKPMNSQTPEKILAQFRHGVIYFEENGMEAKFLLPPSDLDDPLMIFQALLDKQGFGLPPPPMNIQLQEMCLLNDGQYIYAPNWSSVEGGGWVRFFPGPKFGDTDETSVANYRKKMVQVSKAVVEASMDCGAWLFGYGCLGGHSAGVELFRAGVESVRMTSKGRKPVLLAAAMPEQFEELQSGQNIESQYTLKNMAKLNAAAVAKPLGEKPTERLIYPNCRHLITGDWAWDDKFLNSGPTHYIFFQQTSTHQNLLKKFVTCMRTDAFMNPVRITDLWADEAFTQKLLSEIRDGMTTFVFNVNDLGHRLEKGHRLAVQRLQAAAGSEEKPKQVQAGEEKLPPIHIDDSIPLDKLFILDISKVTAEEVRGRITRALSSTSTSDMKEFGFQEAESRRLSNAWKLYTLYHASCTRQFALANMLFLWIVLSSLATTILSVLIAAHESHQDAWWHVWLATYVQPLSIASAIMPLASSFVLSLQNSFNPLVKGQMLRSAVLDLVCEIFQYRGRVLAYKPADAQFLKRMAMGSLFQSRKVETPEKTTQDAESASADNGPISLMKALPPKDTFQLEVNDITSRLMDGEMKTDALREPTQHEIAKAMGILFKAPSVAAPAPYHPLLDEESAENKDGHVELGDDDGLIMLSGEQYVRYRLKPALSMFMTKAPWLRLGVRSLQVSIFAFTLLTGVLGIRKLNVYMPILAAFTASIQATLDFTQLDQQLRKTNAAIVAIQNVLNWWQSLSEVEKRLDESKEQLIATTEASIRIEDVNYISRASVQKGSKKDAKESAGKKAAGASHSTDPTHGS